MSLVGTTELVTILVTGSLNTLSRAAEEVKLVRGVVGSLIILYVVVMSPNDGIVTSLLSPELTSVTSTRSDVPADVVGARLVSMGRGITPAGEVRKH